MGIYTYTVKAQDGSQVRLSHYSGKVLLVVNTATDCGFTPQYADLQRLYDEFRDRGFEILDFPCNQFGGQAPGSDEEIRDFCTGRFGITFPQFAKVDVSGDSAEPLFTWLSDNAGFKGFDKLHPLGMALDQMLKNADPNYRERSGVKWNFTKFLIGRDGEVIGRFEPTASMVELRSAIEEALV